MACGNQDTSTSAPKRALPRWKDPSRNRAYRHMARGGDRHKDRQGEKDRDRQKGGDRERHRERNEALWAEPGRGQATAHSLVTSGKGLDRSGPRFPLLDTEYVQSGISQSTWPLPTQGTQEVGIWPLPPPPLTSHGRF